MEHPTPQQILIARVDEFALSIKLLLDARHTLPALIVLYTGIDIFGALLRPETELDTAGKYFKQWASDYLLANSQLPCTADDLWGARCGLLHTHTADSRESRRGAARQLHYFRGRLPEDTQNAITSVAAKGKIFVDVDLFFAAFEAATRGFLRDVQRDSQLEQRVLHHSSRVFGGWRYVG
jgi:hypothetical protein